MSSNKYLWIEISASKIYLFIFYPISTFLPSNAKPYFLIFSGLNPLAIRPVVIEPHHIEEQTLAEPARADEYQSAGLSFKFLNIHWLVHVVQATLNHRPEIGDPIRYLLNLFHSTSACLSNRHICKCTKIYQFCIRITRNPTPQFRHNSGPVSHKTVGHSAQQRPGRPSKAYSWLNFAVNKFLTRQSKWTHYIWRLFKFIWRSSHNRR